MFFMFFMLVTKSETKPQNILIKILFINKFLLIRKMFKKKKKKKKNFFFLCVKKKKKKREKKGKNVTI